ncbi:DUF6932 family protein [Bacteroides sp.]
MIPDFNEKGYLDPGIYEATFEEVKDKLGFSKRRQRLLGLMEGLLMECKQLSCDIIYLDGSFVSTRLNPNDYDACWDTSSKDRESVINNVLASVLSSESEFQKQYYGGEISPAFDKSPCNLKITVLDYFQKTQEGDDKGIVLIKL